MTNSVRQGMERAVELGEVGIQVAAYLGEELVVDEWIGTTTEAGGTPVDADTLFPIFSVTKAFVSTALHIQAERGLVDYETPMAHYWPEFAQNGKGDILVRHVLTHRSGAPQMPEGTTPERLRDWDWIVDGLAKLTPLYPTNTRSTYQALSFGHLIGEIVRRTDPKHRLAGQFVREELCDPLGITDLFIGLPPEEEHRVATLIDGMTPKNGPVVAAAPNPAMPAGAAGPELWNRADMHQSVVPGSGGIISARAGARFFALLAQRGEFGGRRYIGADRLLSFTAPRPDPDAIDTTLGTPMWLGTGGYWIGGEGADPVFGTAPHILAHKGAGGSYGYADLDTGFSACICHNRMFPARVAGEHPFAMLADALRKVAVEG